MLNAYLSQVRYLVRDADANFFSDAQLTLAINQARQRVAAESACLRLLNTLATVAGTETYAPPTSMVGMLGMSVLYGTLRTALAYRPWPEFQARCRALSGLQSIPAAWTYYGGQIYLAPIPADAYTIEIDTIVLPVPLVLDTDPEPLVYPYTDCVQYLAAAVVKLNVPNYDEANALEQRFHIRMKEAGQSVEQFAIMDPYGFAAQ